MIIDGIRRLHPLLIPAEQVSEYHGVRVTLDGGHGGSRVARSRRERTGCGLYTVGDLRENETHIWEEVGI